MDPFISHHLRGVSRTYALLVPMLPAGLSDAVGLAYLLMRIIDTYEDAPELAHEARAAGLSRLESVLSQLAPDAADPREAANAAAPPLADSAATPRVGDLVAEPAIGETAAERALMVEAPRVLAQLAALDAPYRDAIAACGLTMIRGVREFFERSAARELPYPAIRGPEELRRYCYFVAGVVGEMLCRMMAHFLRLPTLLRLRELAVELGIGLQLVNILKDALKDSYQGRRYLPATDGAAVGGAASYRDIYQAALSEARTSLQKGVEFVLALPAAARGLRAFCGLPIAWGAMTLARAERDAGKAKISRGAVQASIALFARLGGDDRALREWFDGLLRPAPQPA
ncbi:MAG: squalene/phytoene synthase family protein [Phycisphaerae bacterium]